MSFAFRTRFGFSGSTGSSFGFSSSIRRSQAVLRTKGKSFLHRSQVTSVPLLVNSTFTETVFSPHKDVLTDLFQWTFAISGVKADGFANSLPDSISHSHENAAELILSDVRCSPAPVGILYGILNEGLVACSE